MATQDLLSAPSDDSTYEPLERTPSAYHPLYSYRLPKGEDKHYQQQYGDMYFLRLAKLKPAVEAIAQEAWEDLTIAGEKARRVDRVLDVRQGQLCWIVGTVFMDMPLKPNVLDDISKDHLISAVPPREKYLSPYGSATTQTMLEDESGRLRLTGPMLANSLLVTGCIVAIVGTENANGDFEVIEVKVPDLPRQPQRWERDHIANIDRPSKIPTTTTSKGGHNNNNNNNNNNNKVALISGLGISDTSPHLSLTLLSEYLLGESGTPEADQGPVSQISRLIIAGNSLASSVIPDVAASTEEATTGGGTLKKLNGAHHHKKYGYDASAYNPVPTANLDSFLAELLPSIPITIIPGETDPANATLPQQPVHPAMFPHARAYVARVTTDESTEPNWFDCVTNPWEGDVEGWRWMGNSGQPVDDILRYVDLDDDESLVVMESCLRWRCVAPTAPDTLWCYPFQDEDQFVLRECPHVYFAGNQKKFDTAVVEGEAGQQRVRLIAVPKFFERGEVVLVDTETLEVELLTLDGFHRQDQYQS